MIRRRLLAGLALGLLSFVAGAAPVPERYYQVNLPPLMKNKSADAVCGALVAAKAPDGKFARATPIGTGSGAMAYCHYTKPASTTPTQEFSAGSYYGYNCTTALPYFDDGAQVCVAEPPPPPPPPCPVGPAYSKDYIYPPGVTESSVGKANLPRTDGACEVVPTGATHCKLITGSSDPSRVGRIVCTFTVQNTGNPAGAAGAGDPSLDAGGGATDTSSNKSKMPPSTPSNGGSCPKGTVQGGFDSRNIPICIGTGSNPDNSGATPQPKVEKPTVTTANEDGSTTTTKETVTTNSDGSTTTTKETVTTGADGTVSKGGTSETSNTPLGSPGNADLPEEKTDLCAQNPMLSICRESSVSGSCGEIVCTGDAIQCATLRAAAAMECRTKQDRDDLLASPLKDLGLAAVAGSDPLKGGFPSASTATVIDVPTSLDSSGWLGGGAYFKDKVVTVQGHSITLPFSQTEDIMLTFRYALMLVASLVSFNILRTAVLT